ncbi:MAG: hypothetical protein HWN79_18630 [Candidatus Lokiarchaeota archaeon]|nr:hypothetical protein [Candidatus Lokiarchaeota archaeon]
MYPLLHCKHLGKTLLSLFTVGTGRCGEKIWDFELWGKEYGIATSLRSSQ